MSVIYLIIFQPALFEKKFLVELEDGPKKESKLSTQKMEEMETSTLKTEGKDYMVGGFKGLYFKTYWPAGGERGQNSENTAQGHKGHIASLGTYRIVNRVPAGRILSTGRALGRDLCDKDFVLVRLQQANM